MVHSLCPGIENSEANFWGFRLQTAEYFVLPASRCSIFLYSCSCEQHWVVFQEICVLLLWHKDFWYSSWAKKELLLSLAKENPPKFCSSQPVAAFNDNLVYSYSWSSWLHVSNLAPQTEEWVKARWNKTKKSLLEEINPCSCIIHLRETVSHRLHPYISLMDQIQNWNFNWWGIYTHCVLLLILKVLACVRQQA